MPPRCSPRRARLAGSSGGPVLAALPWLAPPGTARTVPSTSVSDHLDAGEVLLATSQHQPRTTDQVGVRWNEVGVLDALVVQVGASLTDRASRRALAGHQPGRDEEIHD